MASGVRGGGGASTGRPDIGRERPMDNDRGGGNGQGGRGGSAAPRGGGGAGTGRPAAGKERPIDRPGGGQGGSGGGTFIGGSGQTRDQMQTQDQLGANVANAQNDYNDRDNNLAENIGNFIAGMFGFNEMDPTAPGFSQPGAPGQTGQADWGFDPAGLIGGGLAGAFGVPVIGGFLADQISSALGRPLQVNLGPSVFGGPTTDPITGEVTPGETTVSGPSMTVRDRDQRDTFYGAPPALAGFGGGVANVSPTSSTFLGVDPAPVQPNPPPAPQVPLPDGLSPTEPVAPGDVSIDPGNTGLSASDLASLFQQMGSRIYRGKNRSGNQIIT